MSSYLQPFVTLIGINDALKYRPDKNRENINRMKFTIYNNITKEISYLVYEGHFDANSIKDMTPYERQLHLHYVIDRIKQYNENVKGK